MEKTTRAHLSAMAEIAGQMAVRERSIQVFMFWRRAALSDEHQYEELFLFEDSAVAVAVEWVSAQMVFQDRDVAPLENLVPVILGGDAPLPPLDYPRDIQDVNTWFENNNDWTGGVMPIDLDITTVVNNNGEDRDDG